MIKLTYKCKVLPLKLDCVLKQFNIDQSQRDSLLQYFLTRISNDMTKMESMKTGKILTEIKQQHIYDDGGGDEEDDDIGRSALPRDYLK